MTVHHYPFASLDLLLLLRDGPAPAVLLIAPKYAYPTTLLEEKKAESDVCFQLLACRDLIFPLMEEQICTPDTENNLAPLIPATSSASSSILDTGH